MDFIFVQIIIIIVIFLFFILNNMNKVKISTLDIVVDYLK